jgi:hypothetical protein
VGGCCPLLGAHRARPGVGQEIDQHVGGRESEEVLARLFEEGGPLVAGGHAYWLNRLDLEWLDDRLEALGCAHAGAGKGHQLPGPLEPIADPLEEVLNGHFRNAVKQSTIRNPPKHPQRWFVVGAEPQLGSHAA